MDTILGRGALSRANRTKPVDKGSWLSLPGEIRSMILEQIARQKHAGWASGAAVCTEWQAAIEPKNFRHLSVDELDLEEFERVVFRRRELVQHIYLKVELSRYACGSCHAELYNMASRQHCSIISEAIRKLYAILSTWPPARRLVLEINAHMSGDSENDWLDRHFLTLEAPNDIMLPQGALAGVGFHIPQRIVSQPLRDRPRHMAATVRLYPPLCLLFPERLPLVTAVTKFVMRRQFRRQITPRAIESMLDSLPCLESLVYEPWRAWRTPWKSQCDRELARAVTRALPESLKTISIFEEANEELALAVFTDPRYASILNANLPPHPDLVRAFAKASIPLERISVAYMFHAEQFFAACRPSYTWDRLRSLTLTSAILSQTSHNNKISEFLQNAAAFALNIPLLECMALWNSKDREACATIYQKDLYSRRATLTLRGTWDLELDEDTIMAWEKVIPESYELHASIERMELDINGIGDAIHHLNLPAGVVDPTTLRQMRYEGLARRRRLLVTREETVVPPPILS